MGMRVGVGVGRGVSVFSGGNVGFGDAVSAGGSVGLDVGLDVEWGVPGMTGSTYSS